MNKLNICYFDNIMGEFNEYNPRFVFNQNHVKNIVDILSNKSPFYYTNEQIKTKLKIKNENEYRQAIIYLNNISAIVEKDNKLTLNFTFFTSKDIKKIKYIVKNELNKNKELLANKISNLKPKINQLYPAINKNISLYHILCGKIFDGEFFDYLSNDGFLKLSYKKQDNRDYMIIGYHDNFICNKFNNSLFCSFNNARYKQNSLTSFGTPDERFDYFRYFKLRAINKLHGKFNKLHSLLYSYDDETIVKNSIEIINKIIQNKSVDDNNFFEALKLTGYISVDNKILVPVFNNYIENVKIIRDIIINTLGDDIKRSLNNIKEQVINSKISCLTHGAPIDEICNELWHIFFGLLNNYLINKKIVASPKKYLRQGQYLKCIYLFDSNSSM